jgi:hypothetical protein
VKITIELEDQSDNDAAAICAWLDMVLRDEGHTVGKITWTPSATVELT